jgi:hypothetical protein
MYFLFIVYVFIFIIYTEILSKAGDVERCMWIGVCADSGVQATGGTQ